MVAQKVMVLTVLRLLANAYVSQKIDLFIFAYASKQISPPGSYHYPQERRKLSIPSEQAFS